MKVLVIQGDKKVDRQQRQQVKQKASLNVEHNDFFKIPLNLLGSTVLVLSQREDDHIYNKKGLISLFTLFKVSSGDLSLSMPEGRNVSVVEA